MGRPKKEHKKVQNIEVNETPKEEQKTAEEVMKETEAINADLNIAQASKDIRIKNIQQLEAHEKEIRESIKSASRELEVKYKALKQVDDENKAQQYTLSKQKEKFDKENEAALKNITVKTKELEEAGEAYTKLLSEVQEKKNQLNSDLSKISDERKSHQKEIERINKHLKDISDDIAVREENIKELVEKLTEDQKVFEEEKESLKPELSRLAEVKGENQALWDKIESDKKEFDLRQTSFESYKSQKDVEVKQAYAKVLEKERLLQVQDGKLRKWEQDLKDLDLEMKAREIEAKKMMQRYQLTEKIKG